MSQPSNPNPWADTSSVSQSEISQPLGSLERLDFRAAIEQNRRNTWFLVMGMLLLAAFFGYVIGWGWDTAFTHTIATGINYTASGQVDWQLLLLTPSRTGIIIAISLASAMAVWSLISILRADKIVLDKTEATEVSSDEMPQLHNIVEEMAIAAGVPKPRVVVVPTDVPNAFATGLHTDKAVVGVTQGLLSQLNRRELQGVIAHEMSHIVNGDMRYATILAVMTGVLVFVAQILLNARYFLGSVGSSRDDRKGGNPVSMVIMLFVFMLMAILVPIIAQIIQMAVSRQREYLADANAIQLTRDPGGLISALEKISQYQEPAKELSAGLEPLFIIPPSKLLHKGNIAWFSTHPPLEKRIERLKALE